MVLVWDEYILEKMATEERMMLKKTSQVSWKNFKVNILKQEFGGIFQKAKWANTFYFLIYGFFGEKNSSNLSQLTLPFPLNDWNHLWGCYKQEDFFGGLKKKSTNIVVFIVFMKNLFFQSLDLGG